MIKIFIAFLAFAALALYVLTQSGGDIDLGGEKHDVGAPAAVTAAPAPAVPASAASQ